MKYKYLFFSFIAISILVCYSFEFFNKSDNNNNPNNNSLLKSKFSKNNLLEIPLTLGGETIIYHLGYSLVYSETHEQAKWVAYVLNRKELVGVVEREDKFRPDPSVPTGSASNSDYKKSGYDRGHLAPAADMKWSEKAMSESFFYSNMSPQLAEFNRGVWKKLEEKVRDWALENDSLLIVTGPILTIKNCSKKNTIGLNLVTVPEYYYKAILDFKKDKSKSIAFILPNKGSKLPLQNFAVSIDYLEKFSEINFFHKLDDNLEKIVESKVCISCWSW